MGVRTAVRKQTTQSSRQELLDALDYCESLCQTDPTGTMRIALDISKGAELAGYPDIQAQALIRCSEASFRLGRLDPMAEYLRQADDVLSVASSLNERLFLYNAWSLYYMEQGEQVRAYEYLQRLLCLCVSAEHRRFRSRALNSLGNLFIRIGAYDTALSYFLECLEIGEQDQDQRVIGVVLVNIGRLYLELEDYHRALEYCLRGLSISTDLNDLLGMADDMKNVAAMYGMLQDHSQAIGYLQRSLEIWRNVGNKKKEADILAFLGKAHSELGDLTLALSYMQEALLCAEESTGGRESAFIHLSLGSIHQKRKEYDAALNECLEAMRLYGQFGFRYSENDVRSKVSEIYEVLGDYQKSLEHHREYLRVRDELQSVGMQRSIADQEVRQALQKAEEEKESLRRQAEQASREVEARMKELNALTVDLTERNEALKRIREDLLPLLRVPEEGTRSNATRIVRQIDEVISVEKRNLFQEQFEGVYQEFIRRLRELCPNLTPSEIRICVLIKLNLSNKQIAEMLFASPLTIKTHRARIRRKLGLNKKESLSSLLLAM